MALIDKHIQVMYISGKDNPILDTRKVEEKFGVKPHQIPDLLLLVGDQADNIPGVRGIGKETAVNLLKKYGSIEGVLEHINELPLKISTALKSEYDRIKSLKSVYKLREDAFEGDIEELRVKPPKRNELIKILRELEFFSALLDISETPDLPEILPYKGERFSAISYYNGTFYLSDGKSIFKGDNPTGISEKFCINAKEIYKKYPDIGILYDLSIGDYLLLPEIEESTKERHTLESLALKYKAWKVPPNVGAFSSYLSSLIGDEIIRSLKEDGLWEIYINLELPLSKVLAYMEKNGVMVSVEILRQLEHEIVQEIGILEERIYENAGQRFNLNSPKQLANILFNKLKLPPVKKTKTGYSTDIEVLIELSKIHELPRLIIDYRELFKLKSTYIEPLSSYISHDGRIHPTFSQTTTATGRLSCYNPNLQNIPARGRWGKKLRKAFVSPEGYKLYSFDYSQIELRILAHLSGDENLRKIFAENRDIHYETAKFLFGKEEISEDERRVAKTVNFGITYGISPYGLSKSIGVDIDVAKRMIDSYYSRFPGVREWQRYVMEFASKNRYVQTLMGRRRYIFADPEKNDAYRRITINTPVQGSAADLIKKAMIDIYNILKGKKSRMILQVHDELLFEISEDEEHLVGEIKSLMENAIKLDVPIVVEVGEGKSWADTKG